MGGHVGFVVAGVIESGEIRCVLVVGECVEVPYCALSIRSPPVAVKPELWVASGCREDPWPEAGTVPRARQGALTSGTFFDLHHPVVLLDPSQFGKPDECFPGDSRPRRRRRGANSDRSQRTETWANLHEERPAAPEGGEAVAGLVSTRARYRHVSPDVRPGSASTESSLDELARRVVENLR